MNPAGQAPLTTFVHGHSGFPDAPGGITRLPGI